MAGAFAANAVQRRWGLCLVVTVILALALSGLAMPGAWLVGSTVAAGLVAIIGGGELKPARTVLRPAQSVVGIMAAAPLAAVGFDTARGYFAVSAVVSIATLGLCLGCAAVVFWSGRGAISRATAVLSTLAGGASGISTMAVEMDVDHRYVAFSQYLRLVLVTITLPFVLVAVGLYAGSVHGTAPALSGQSVIAVLVVIGFAGLCGERLRMPAPYLLAPLVVTVGLELVLPSLRFDLPFPVTAVAYAVIGWQAGGSFTRSSVRLFVRLLPITLTLIAVMIAACFALAVGVAMWLDIPLGQAYLATSPGGIYAVMATAADTGAGPVVSTLQVIRLLTMVLAAAVAARMLAAPPRSVALERSTEAGSDHPTTRPSTRPITERKLQHG